MPSLSAITIYPLKSAAGIALQSVSLDRFGPVGDRRWILVDDRGRFVSQREESGLARLAAVPEEDGLMLCLDSDSCAVAVPAGDRTIEVQIWEDRVRAVDSGDAASDWLTERLGRRLRLVYMPEASHRYVDGRYAANGETVSFADGFPLLLVSESALDLLNEKLSAPVGLDRFRPNLIVSGCKPHAEDGWKKIRIGDLEFDVAKPCARCVVPSVNQQTGEKDSEILRALASYRRGEDRQVTFGQNLLYQETGRLTVGDRVEVLA